MWDRIEGRRGVLRILLWNFSFYFRRSDWLMEGGAFEGFIQARLNEEQTQLLLSENSCREEIDIGHA